MIFGKHINRYYLCHAPMLLLGLLALVLVDFFQLKIPELYRILINGLNGEIVFDKEVLLWEIGVPMTAIVLAMVVGRFLWRVAFFGTAVKVETDLRNRMFDRAKDFSRSYYQKNKVGNMMSLYTNDLDTIQECFGDGVLMFFDALLLGVLALVKMWQMDRFLTLLSMIPMAFLLGIGTVLGISMMKKWETRQETFSKLSDFAQESFSGIAVVKAFVKELKELLAFKKLNRDNEKVNVEYTRISTLLHILVTLFVESVVAVILGYGGYLVYVDSFNAGQLVEYIGYFTAIVWPIMAVSMLIELTSRGSASMKRISEYLDTEIEVVDRPGVRELTSVKGEIEFRNLSFAFSSTENHVLHNVSFHILPGENVGIVGKTGAGKTVIADLILRMYNVPDGVLFIDGEDVNDVSIRSVRAGLSYVPQDNFLFSDTIFNNIAFAGKNADDKAVHTVAENADIHASILEFTDSYETVLGERGVTVSGGQKQRISIARALLADAPVLILDDAVSAVDVDTERKILSRLRETREGKTTIMIAHRISTVMGMDKIIYLSGGTVAAVGTHETLYATCPEYRCSVDLQRLEDEVGGEDHA